MRRMTSENTVGITPRTGASPVPAACSGGCRFFANEDGTRAPLPSAGPLLRLPRHTTIYERGDAAPYCYKVIEGSVRLSHILIDGQRQVLEICVPGDTFGIESNGAYSASAETIGETALLRCPRVCVLHLSDEQPELRRAMMDMLSRGLCTAHDHLTMLGHQSAKARVASYLLRFMSDRKPQKGAITIELPVGRQDMADYLGLTIETTCRSLSDLKSAKVIATPSRHRVVVYDRAALEGIATGGSQSGTGCR